MIRSCLFVLVAGLQVISSQSPPTAADARQAPFAEPYQERIPRHCWGPPPDVSPYECCPIPQVFSDEEMSTCGIEKPNPENPPPPPEKFADEEFASGPGPGPRHGHHGPHHGPPDGRREKWCSHGKCLMKNKGLLTDEEEIDYPKTRTFIEEWAKANPDYEDAIKIAIDKCVVEGGPKSNHGKCEADKIFFCMTSTILWNCKLRQDLEQCTVLQEHMDECRPYYMKPADQE
ncbi:unnamed protein product [Chrysodeixis includens]|uniref:Uncharacterized protein n=1 Tax=Chrysodeixis includens TaxID=689277 RepID=A0A9P0BTL4_CHRIL|nr:unnamed protein product [Chrysodeixis includens]